MKKLLIIAATCITMLSLSSCDWMYMFDKLSYESYITNATDSDVTITYSNAYQGTSPVFVKAGDTVEVSDVLRWDLHVKTASKDTVYFEFANGESYTHIYERVLDGTDQIKYYPEENNIFKVDLLDCAGPYSWVETSIRPKRIRSEYTVR